MRDIRSDLQERLDNVEKELHGIEGKYKSLQTMRENLRAMLAAESAQWAQLGAQKPLFSSANGNGSHAESENNNSTLSNILRDALADQKKKHLKELSKAAVDRGYPFGQKKPGRVVHFALLGMRSGQLVDQLGEGWWRLHAAQ